MPRNLETDYPNKVRYYRELILGLRLSDMMKLIYQKNGGRTVSDKTIKNVERTNKGTYATKTRILIAINAELTARGKAEITFADLYPSG